MLLCYGATVKAAKIHSAAGSTSAAFLKIGVGPRAVAMANTYAGVSDDIHALYWNPGGLTQLAASQATFMHSEYFQGLNQEYFSYAHRLANGHVLAGGFNSLYTPKDIERRSGDNENDPLAPLTEPEGLFRAYDMAFSLGYARPITDTISMGASLKGIQQTIDSESALGVGTDWGILWKPPVPRLRVGGVIQNLGPGIQFNEKSYHLPLNFKAGASYTVLQEQLLLALDLNQPIDNYLFTSLGLEYQWKNSVFVRTGYRYRLHGNELGVASGVGAGMGAVIKGITVDYAYTPFGDLGDAHRFSLTMRFGKTLFKKVAVKPAKPAEESVPSSLVSEPQSSKTCAFTVQAKPLQLSQRGIKCEILAESSDCALKSILYSTMARSIDNIVVAVTEEEGIISSLMTVYKGYTASASVPLATSHTGFTITLEKAWLESQQKRESDIMVMALSENQWTEVTTRVLSETEGSWLIRGDVRAFEKLLVGVKK